MTEMATFNIQNGYTEGILRGLRTGFLTPDSEGGKWAKYTFTGEIS